MKDTQGRVMDVMKELVTIQGQLDLCEKMLEISNAYEELDRYFRLANPVAIRPCHAPSQSLLTETPRVVRAIVPLPSHTRGAVDMLILHDNDPSHQWVVRCFGCRKVGHVVSQCLRKKRNPRCANCSGTHKLAKCPLNMDTTPEATTTGASKGTSGKKMTLLSVSHYSIVLSIPPCTVLSVAARSRNTWKWSAQCTSIASSTLIGGLGILLSATHATLQVKSAGELMLTITRKIGTRVVTRQSQVDFVSRRGIML